MTVGQGDEMPISFWYGTSCGSTSPVTLHCARVSGYECDIDSTINDDYRLSKDESFLRVTSSGDSNCDAKLVCTGGSCICDDSALNGTYSVVSTLPQDTCGIAPLRAGSVTTGEMNTAIPILTGVVVAALVSQLRGT